MLAVDLRIDPRAEWGEMFEEPPRINRDYFYHEFSRSELGRPEGRWCPDPHASSRADVERIMRWTLSGFGSATATPRPGSGFRRRAWASDCSVRTTA